MAIIIIIKTVSLPPGFHSDYSAFRMGIVKQKWGYKWPLIFYIAITSSLEQKVEFYIQEKLPRYSTG